MGKDLTTALRPALAMTLLFALLLGIVYPFAMTGIGQAIFPSQANGSLVRDAGGKVIGSAIVGQAFTSERYFQTRPSAAGKGYDGLSSSGSNLGPASKALVDRVTPDVAKRRGEGVSGPLPADLVTASGSGLDPDLSPESALAQAPRVAKARGVPLAEVRALVERQTEDSVLGDPHVKLLALNRALDAAATATNRSPAR